MGFIQVDQGVVTHRKTLRLARLLGEDRYTITGRLVALWTWCLDSAISGSLAHIEPDILADVMGYPGKPAELVEGLITVGFLDLGEDGHLSIHKWQTRMGQLIQRRADAAERMRRLRSSRRADGSYLPDAEAPDSALQAGGSDVDGCNGPSSSHSDTRADAVTRTFASRARHVTDKSKEEKRRVTYSEGSTHERENARSRAGSQGADAPALSPVLSPALAPALAAATDSSIGSRVSHPDASVVRVQPRAGGASCAPVSLPHPVAADLPAPSAPLALELSPPANPANPAKAARKPDVLWDACVAAMGASPSNTVERGKWNKGLAALRESGATPDEITLRCGRYRRRFGPEVPLHPMALAGNWTQLAQEVSPHANQINQTNQVRPSAFTSGQARQGYQAARSVPAGGRVPFAGRGRAGVAGGSVPAALRVGTPEYYDAYERREAARRAEFNTLPASAG